MPGQKRGRKPGPVWQFFTLEDDKLHAKCNSCGIRRCKNGVTLENHMDVCEELSDHDKLRWQQIMEEREQNKSPRLKRRRTHLFGDQDTGHFLLSLVKIPYRNYVLRTLRELILCCLLSDSESVSDRYAIRGPVAFSGDELEQHRVALSRWIYASSTPFTVVESKHFKQFLAHLCPAFALPTRFDVSNKYLTLEEVRLRKMMEKALTKAQFCTLSVDGAEDQGKMHVYHVCALTPRPYFLGTIRFGATTHSAKKILDELAPFMDRLEQLTVDVVGMMTDNEPRMVSLRETFQRQQKRMCIPGCGAHAGNLIIKDVLKHENVKPVVDAAKQVAVAIKNTKLRAYLKLKLGVAEDHRIGVPLASCDLF